MPQDPAIRERARRMADAARINRGKLKTAMKDGQVDWYDLFCGNVPEWEPIAKKIKFRDLILAIPGVGPVTADELMGEAGVPTDVRTYALTYELRQKIADLARNALSTWTA